MAVAATPTQKTAAATQGKMAAAAAIQEYVRAKEDKMAATGFLSRGQGGRNVSFYSSLSKKAVLPSDKHFPYLI